MAVEKDLSVIVPIHNDADTISITVNSILDFFDKEAIDGELIVVNDGGTEEGVEKVEKLIKDGKKIIFVNRKINKGKGYSVREGMSKAGGDILIFTDADLPYGTDSIKKMYNLLLSGEYSFVLGSRNLSGKQGMRQATFIRKIAHFVYSVFVGIIMLKYSDVSAGLKGMRREVFDRIRDKLTIDRFAFDIELLLLVKKNGFKVGEIPVVLTQIGKSKNLNVIYDSPQMIKDVFKIVLRNMFGYYDTK